ncbi:hypothetical protein NMY22_g16427 [Coprinellus aureogranulatus]|nr:hypothetical protein NMY22_g16427 [Coprinellus aureogranulatus]
MPSHSEHQASTSLAAFFGQYSGFTYNPAKSATSEFRRLRNRLNLQGGGAEDRSFCQAFADTLGNQFNQKYGTEMSDISAWQRLCRRLGVSPIPERVDEAQQVSVLDQASGIETHSGRWRGWQLKTFPTKEALRKYTTKQKKSFPKQCSTAGAILSSLINAGGRSAAGASGGQTEASVESLAIAVDSAHISSPEGENNVTPSTGSFAQHGPLVEAPSEDEEDGALPLRAFFVQYTQFHYQSSRSATSEFRRLCKTMGWEKKDPNRTEAYMDWSDAMADQFGRKYGVDINDLGAWQRLCERLGIDPVPDVLEEARELVYNTHVNLVELVDEGTVKKFPTEKALSNYSKRKRKIFPRDSLAAGDILTSLLRYIKFPPPEGSRRTSSGELVPSQSSMQTAIHPSPPLDSAHGALDFREGHEHRTSSHTAVASTLHAAIHSAKARKGPRQPLPSIIIDNLRQAVQSAEERSAHSPPTSPTAETLRQVAVSAKARTHHQRSPSLDSLLDIVRSAEARKSPPPPSLGSVLQQAAQSSATARHTRHGSASSSPVTVEPAKQVRPSAAQEALPESSRGGRSSPDKDPAGPAIDPSNEKRWVFYKAKTTIDELEHGELGDFFAKFRGSGFVYRPSAPPMVEFRRMADHLRLRRDSFQWRTLFEAFGRAMVAEFESKFGRDMGDLTAWRRLCSRIGIEPIPTTLDEARFKFKETHVNLVELMETSIPDGEMPKFKTEEDLAEYTLLTRQIFPRALVPKGSILEDLLRHISD